MRLMKRWERIKLLSKLWWRPRQTDEKDWLDVGHGFSPVSSQSTAQYPRQQSQQEVDDPDEKAKGMFVNESVKVFQS
jgi:hypothetical protein